MPGQSSRKSKSSNRRLVTKSLISGVDMGFTTWGLGIDLTDKVREWPFAVAVVAVEAVDGGRDMVAIAVHTFAQCSS
jgi:hypothetical protein